MTQMNSAIAIFESHNQADEAVREIEKSGIDMKKLAIVGQDHHTDEHVVGYYNAGDRMMYWRKHGFVAESTQEHRFMNELNTFYDSVLPTLPGVDSVLITGPGEAKGEFQERFKSKKSPAQVVELKAADKMTNPQIAALVRQHFELIPN